MLLLNIELPPLSRLPLTPGTSLLLLSHRQKLSGFKNRLCCQRQIIVHCRVVWREMSRSRNEMFSLANSLEMAWLFDHDETGYKLEKGRSSAASQRKRRANWLQNDVWARKWLNILFYEVSFKTFLFKITVLFHVSCTFLFKLLPNCCFEQ